MTDWLEAYRALVAEMRDAATWERAHDHGTQAAAHPSALSQWLAQHGTGTD